MFTSPYSPFFTSGLLTNDAIPRRGSMPSSQASSKASVYYFTLQQARDEHQFRSFLSLDLAESQSSRSLSHPTLRVRSSRDFTNPRLSPKPAPSIGLPAIPTTPKAPLGMHHRLSRSSPSLPLSASSTSKPRRPSSARAAPPAPLPLRAHGLSHVDDAARRASLSTVSTGYRRDRRSAALAALEGRAAPPSPSSAIRYPFIAAIARGIEGTMTKRNFMSMSDDEDDGDDEDEDADEGFESGDASDSSSDDDDCASMYVMDDTHDLQLQFANYTLTPPLTAASPAPSSAAPSPPSTPLLTPFLSAAAPWLHRNCASSTTAGDPLRSFIDLRDVHDECARRSRALLVPPTPLLSVHVGGV
ncbi:hypothetical protein HGRIS_004031 [Hohenbuehelia grisea]|uniref:Uncharacterized protein n=1 Tax=Hohenbuehelia grisea TaxID=104357 RepID=A0ABR3JH92_9AGAR